MALQRSKKWIKGNVHNMFGLLLLPHAGIAATEFSYRTVLTRSFDDGATVVASAHLKQ